MQPGFSRIRVITSLVTVPHATSTGISGSRDVLMVRSSVIFTSSLRLPSRIVDVINVAGHRLSTAEIESALILHKGVAETAGKFRLALDVCYR
jgi:hypothetical protein